MVRVNQEKIKNQTQGSFVRIFVLPILIARDELDILVNSFRICLLVSPGSLLMCAVVNDLEIHPCAVEKNIASE